MPHLVLSINMHYHIIISAFIIITITIVIITVIIIKKNLHSVFLFEVFNKKQPTQLVLYKFHIFPLLLQFTCLQTQVTAHYGNNGNPLCIL